ncbi:ion channel [Vibrio fluvialis]|jgi:voltage-gated potassium channel|uniref:ion channel n=1 Tax=Vibrio fluvialis TaxID=676 RepID=UPI001C9D519C|nr:ion channel [Vibrio fluvialis]MBY8137292.1 NAD-binding protein [Vibrio fluvialis]MBY8161701.1 NAD-binding protein [Vibrio fluvialis]MCG6363300.1 ion channel [Vibrio fluvialis]
MKMNKNFIDLWDKYLSKVVDNINRLNVSLIALVFILLVYVALHLLGETHLVETPARFLYFIVVVASTVGFGDYSPQTEAGQLFTAFFIIPISITLFAVVAAKLAAKAAALWYRKIKGRHTMNYKNHIVILGYNREKTPLLIRQLKREEQRKIVLVSREEQENPLPEFVDFINVTSFTNAEELSRANISHASCIVVDTDKDDTTLTLALFVTGLNKEAHLVAHFTDDIKGQILKSMYPKSECISNLSTELLAKSVIDSGSSLVHSELVSAHQGQTQYAIQVPVAVAPFPLSEVFLLFKIQVEATIIGLRRFESEQILLNAKLTTEVRPGDTLFYISDERIQFSNWP